MREYFAFESQLDLPLKNGQVIPAGTPMRAGGHPQSDPHAEVRYVHQEGEEPAKIVTLTVSMTTVCRLAGWSLPTIEDMNAWAFDSVCETPSGEEVEPDGRDQYGFPSWLRIFNLA